MGSIHRDPLDARWILVTGKGGVGKTAVAQVLAREAAARKGLRPLLVEFEGTAWEPEPSGHGHHRLSIGHPEAVSRYLHRHLRFGPLARALHRSTALQGFFDAAPAVFEVAALDEIEHQSRWFRPVIVDLDATGHADMWLDVPSALRRVVTRGPMARAMARHQRVLADPEHTAIVLVALPLEVVLRETQAMVERLAGQEPAKSVCTVVVNGVPLPFPLPTRPPIGGGPVTPAVDEDLAFAGAWNQRCERARVAVQGFERQVPRPIRFLPWSTDEDVVARLHREWAGEKRDTG